MEKQIENALLSKYNYLNIYVSFIDFRKYKIKIILETSVKENIKEIDYIWDVTLKQNVNINTICNIIDNFILSVYRK